MEPFQGLLELADIAYVGAEFSARPPGWTKTSLKSLFIAAGIPIVKHVTILRGAWRQSQRKFRSW